MSGAASAPPDPELKAHIDEAEKAAQLYDASRNTGNEVLDVVLTENRCSVSPAASSSTR